MIVYCTRLRVLRSLSPRCCTVQRNRIRVLPLFQTKSCLFYLSRWPLKVLPTPAKDVLRFWENNKLVFPRLFAITRKIFCVPGTTAGVERLFSIAGFVLSNRRLSLTDANFHSHVFAHCNFGLAASDQSKRKFDDK